MNSKHTPGPWKTDRAGVNVIDPREKSEYVLAHCKGSTLTEIEANAKLIAASPDLLAALQALLGQEDWEGEDIAPGSPVAIARAAIAKATN